MAFMKSVAQVTSAIRNIKDLEDFQLVQKTTLTAIVMVSRAGGLGVYLCRLASALSEVSEFPRAAQRPGGHRGLRSPFCLSSAWIQLQDSGYNILVADQRGHGQEPARLRGAPKVAGSGLGQSRCGPAFLQRRGLAGRHLLQAILLESCVRAELW